MYAPLHKINFLGSCKDGDRQEQTNSSMVKSTTSTQKSKTGAEERKTKVGDVKTVGNLSVGVRVVIFPEKTRIRFREVLSDILVIMTSMTEMS